MGDRGGRARGDRGGGNRGDGGRGGGRGGRGGRGGGDGGDGGQGRGRGGPPGEGRGGGRGGYQGEGRGGGRGGYQGEGRGGGRGGYQGEGRGGGRGGYQGEGRGGGFRGRGDRGGGRGGGRGNAPPQERHDLPVASPDPAVAITDLENKLRSVESGMASMSIQQAVVRLPERPAFGTQGKKVKLWANSFTVDLKARNDLWVYNIEVKKLSPPSTESKEAPEKEGGPQSEPRQARKDGPASVKGPQLAAVIAEACRLIKHGNAKIALATELKAKLVATSPIILPNDKMQIEIEKCTFVVSLEGGQSVNLDQMVRYLQDMRDDDSTCPKFETAVDALNVVLSHTARNDATISAIGSKRFFYTGGNSNPLASNDTKPQDIFYNLVGICRGYFQSLRLSTGRLLLNTNVTYGVFRLEGKLDDIFRNAKIDRCRRDWTFEMMVKYLSRARVEIRFKESDPGKKEWTTARRTMTGIVQSGAKVTGGDIKIAKEQHAPGPAQVEFHDGTRYISVLDHYKTKYGTVLNPNWPLLNTGTMNKPRFVPAEFLTILPAAIKTKLNDEDSEKMITFACRPPGDNYHFIKNHGRNLLHHESDLLQHFGLEVKPDLITVHGRELSTPTIQYLGNSNNAKVQPRSGSWNMVQKKFASSPSKPMRWGCVAMLSANHVNDERIQAVASGFRDHVNNNCGLPMEPAPTTGIIRCDARSDEKQIRKLLESRLGPHQPQITLVFLNRDTALYGIIKRVCEVHLGLHTVCMDWRKASPAKMAYFGNVALKWNLKAAGINHHLVDRVGLIKDGKTMFVGYDVTHPTNAPKGADVSDPASSSIVGLVASVDKHLNQWPATAWVQPGGMEVCEDDQLRVAIESRLKLWRTRNPAYPEKIIIYRDGVSEGQFTQVLEKELPRIREACAKLYPAKQQPQLAIIVSVKRHHTRFYPTTRENSSKSGNILPGTVVDRGVTQSRYWDFFLTAHECLQGTARPAHYTVLLDEIFRAQRGRRAADDLETVTHDLCYMFGRATRAVSICPPAYYADIVCERVRIHRGALPESGKGPWEVHERLRNEMYYV